MIAVIDYKAYVRRVCFIGGLSGFFLSLALLFYSVAKARPITGYLAQADAAFPYVQRGIFTALCAILLCCFGKGAGRIIAALLSFLLLLYWLLIGVTLY